MTRLLRYTLVGALATAVHYAVLVCGVEWLHTPPAWAAGVGAVVGAQVAFLGNRRFTFGHGGPLGRAWARFQGTAALGAAASALLVEAGVRAGLHYLAAQALATLAGMALTYAVNRAWTFR